MKVFFSTLVFLIIQILVYGQTQDTLITAMGDTLAGTIRLDKDQNKFYFTGRMRNNEPLTPNEVRAFITYHAADVYERKIYYTLLNEFYLLQVENKNGLTLYAHQTYQTRIDDGPKYYMVRNKYCLFKKGTPFFPIKDIFKETMMYLTNDCYEVQQKIKREIYELDEIPTIVVEYNKCFNRNRN